MTKKITRRRFLKNSALALGAVAAGPFFLTGCGGAESQDTVPVYFSENISDMGLLNIYSWVSRHRRLPGKVAVKLHSGEPGGQNFPSPDLIKRLVQSINGTIVECNTAYPGERFNTATHQAVLSEHGFAAIAPVDIMDAEGSAILPFPEGINIRENFVGSHFLNYDSFLVLSHFKGHSMGGFGGAIKNMAIGMASSEGKMWIHTAGVTKNTDEMALALRTETDLFLESMAEAAGSVMAYMGDQLLYVNIMNHLSVDCDCVANPAPARLPDIGILASTDPVALDKACVDLVYASDMEQSADLRRRIESRNGTYILQYAEDLGLGTMNYQLLMVDG